MNIVYIIGIIFCVIVTIQNRKTMPLQNKKFNSIIILLAIVVAIILFFCGYHYMMVVFNIIRIICCLSLAYTLFVCTLIYYSFDRNVFFVDIPVKLRIIQLELLLFFDIYMYLWRTLFGV